MPPPRRRRPDHDDDLDDRPRRRRDAGASKAPWIIAGVAVLVIGGGSAIYLATRKKDRSTDSAGEVADNKDGAPPRKDGPPPKKSPDDLMAMIRGMVNGPDVGGRIRAIEGVARMGEKGRGAIGPLCGLVNLEKNADIRIAAARALGELRAGEAIPVLQVAERDGDRRVAQAATDALNRIDPANHRLIKNPGALKGLLASRDPNQRLFACQKLAELGGEAWTAAGDLVAVLDKDLNSQVRQAAANALGRMGAEKSGGAWLVLNRVLDDPDQAVATAVARAMVEWGPEAHWMLGGLVKASKSNNPTLAATAKLALRKLHPNLYPRETPFDRNDPVEAALADLGAPEPAKQEAAVETLAGLTPVGKHREEVHQLLKERLHNAVVPADKKARVIDALVAWNGKQLSAALTAALGLSGKPETAKARRADLLRALGKIKAVHSAAIIAEFLATPDHEAAAEALRQIGPASENNLLAMVQDHADRETRHRAMLVLRDVGTAASIKPLKEQTRIAESKDVADQALKGLVARLEKDGTKTADILGAPEPAWAVKWKLGGVLGHALAVSPKGDLVAYCDTFKIGVYSAADGKEVKSFPNPIGGIYSLSFSPDGDRLAGVGMNDINKDGGKIWMWEPRTGKEIPFKVAEAPLIRSVAFSPDGRVVAATLARYIQGPKSWVWVGVFDAKTGETRKVLETGHAGAIGGIAFSADGKKLATGSDDMTAKVWDWESGKLLVTCKHARQVRAVDFNPDGTRLAAASYMLDGGVKVYDAANGAELFTCPGLNGTPCVDWSGDGKWIAAGDGANDVRVWDASNGKEVAKLKGVSGTIAAAVFAPDGRRFFTVDFHGLDVNHGLLAWDIADVVRPPDGTVVFPKKDVKVEPPADEKIEQVRRLLKDPDPMKKRQGLAEAGKLGGRSRQLVPDYLTLFNDPDVNVRNIARAFLANLGRDAKAALPAFLELYRTGNAPERKFAESVLQNIDPSALKGP